MPRASANPSPQTPPRRGERPRLRRYNERALRARLDALAATFGIEHISPDPLEVVLRYPADEDREVVGFLGASFAFGSARGAVRVLDDLLARLGGTPAASVRAWTGLRAAERRRRLEGWRHRWIGPDVIDAALLALSRALASHGTLERFFAAGDPAQRSGATGAPSPQDSGDAPPDIGPALTSFARRALALVPGCPLRTAYLFADPSRGGAAKRLCLWLRWMCRRDGVDPGPWTTVSPARLVIPLDVHVARIARYTGLLRRATANWKAATEITALLRTFDAADPVRYDYALCRLGILGTCPGRRAARKCSRCPLYEVCLL